MKTFYLYIYLVSFVVGFPLVILVVDLFIPRIIQLDIYCFFSSLDNADELANNALATVSMSLAAFLDIVFILVAARICFYLMRDNSFSTT